MHTPSIFGGLIALSVSLAGSTTLPPPRISPILEKEVVERLARQTLVNSLPEGIRLEDIQVQKGCSLIITSLTSRTQTLVFDCVINYGGKLFTITPTVESLNIPQIGRGYGVEALTLADIKLGSKGFSASCLYQFDSAGVNYLSGAKSCPSVLPRPLLRIKKQLQDDRKYWAFHA